MIRICRTVAGLRHKISLEKSLGRVIGFVPTMGALHEGHASLLKKARKESDVVVCSIYANPTQFNNESDLEKYPRTEQADLELIQGEEGDLVFIPLTDDIYHSVQVKGINYSTLTQTLEGAHRPGHFDGMSTIVRRLIQIVQPDKAFFGEKDFQQLAIIRRMNDTEGLGAEIIGCPIVRDQDGLALSSRNIRLSKQERENALSLSKSLKLARQLRTEMTPKEVENSIIKELEASHLNPDYVKIVKPFTLEEVNIFEENQPYRLLMAAYSGETRLIDNGEV